jgi:hypothetical protein
MIVVIYGNGEVFCRRRMGMVENDIVEGERV